MGELLIAVGLFVGGHFLLSHPLRAGLVGRLGNMGFMALYSIVAIATIIWAVMAYRAAPTIQLWVAPTWLVWLGYLFMIDACILLAGAFLAPNPSMSMMGGSLEKSTDPQGVMKITRHPLMWAIGTWGMVHILVSGRLETLIFAGGMVTLALGGARALDMKKAAQLGAGWAEYASKTSYWPGLLQMTGRQPFATIWPGWPPMLVGAALFILLFWFHGALVGRPADIF